MLLGMKKRGFGQGRWNGFGGKVEVGESVEQAALRELWEEAGVVPKHNLLRRMGEIDFEFQDTSVSDPLRVFLFVCDGVHGQPRESDEMIPKWFPLNQVPFDQMWPDDKCLSLTCLF